MKLYKIIFPSNQSYYKVLGNKVWRHSDFGWVSSQLCPAEVKAFGTLIGNNYVLK